MVAGRRTRKGRKDMRGLWTESVSALVEVVRFDHLMIAVDGRGRIVEVGIFIDETLATSVAWTRRKKQRMAQQRRRRAS